MTCTRYSNISLVYEICSILLAVSKLFSFTTFIVNVLPYSDAISKLSVFMLVAFIILGSEYSHLFTVFMKIVIFIVNIG